jgi:uncharacterized membrane protein HdeD (DUF308 family)
MNTIIISQVLGIFFAIMGISMVVNSKSVNAAVSVSVENKGILWLWGLLALLTGSIVVVFNNEWTSGLPLFVTILGWLALIKGAFILFFPNAAALLYRKLNKNGVLVFCGVIALIVGLILFYW